ncbi:universal stress protein [Streptomyces alkaliterrae]|uniref:Universal stress protein n=1 Tax=Streptomyces alkaliterrae TaxID=2213162 RepID=A0A5P0YNF8_9ACTN|nr:universal stress protein [Streptomyces alkaliterrae]MBB1259375.1 universal stress protein [Streptomyces alkaliterrae]MQS01775.1 universal stress protein [Streptomyces alkaliterrae]
MKAPAVVVGVDGSPASLEAVEVAAVEARLRGAVLRVVHAFVWPGMHVPTGPSLLGPAGGALREDVERVIGDAVRRAGDRAPDVEVTHAVVAGEPMAVLEAESREAALVVVGSRGMGRITGALVGSVAVHLAGNSRSPVLVVRGRARPEGPLLVAVDGSEESRAAVGFAASEAALRGGELLIVHVCADARPGRSRAEGERVLAEALAVAGRTGGPEGGTTTRLLAGEVSRVLVGCGEDSQLLVMGARGRGGFAGLLLGSVSQDVLRHAACPVAVVQGGADRG